jgi:hypothetical protein
MIDQFNFWFIQAGSLWTLYFVTHGWMRSSAFEFDFLQTSLYFTHLWNWLQKNHPHQPIILLNRNWTQNHYKSIIDGFLLFRRLIFSTLFYYLSDLSWIASDLTIFAVFVYFGLLIVSWPLKYVYWFYIYFDCLEFVQKISSARLVVLQ